MELTKAALFGGGLRHRKSEPLEKLGEYSCFDNMYQKINFF